MAKSKKTPVAPAPTSQPAVNNGDDLTHNMCNVGLKDGDNFMFLCTFNDGQKAYRALQEALGTNEELWDFRALLMGAIHDQFMSNSTTLRPLARDRRLQLLSQPHVRNHVLLDYDAEKVVLDNGARTEWTLEEFAKASLQDNEELSLGIREEGKTMYFNSDPMENHALTMLQKAIAENPERHRDPTILNGSIAEVICGHDSQGAERFLNGISFSPNYDRDHAMLIIDCDLQQVVMADGPQRQIWNFKEFCKLGLKLVDDLSNGWAKDSEAEGFDWFEHIDEPVVCWEQLIGSIGSMY